MVRTASGVRYGMQEDDDCEFCDGFRPFFDLCPVCGKVFGAQGMDEEEETEGELENLSGHREPRHIVSQHRLLGRVMGMPLIG